MKKLFAVLFIVFFTFLSFSQEKEIDQWEQTTKDVIGVDSTRLKTYEGYLNNTEQQIDKVQSQIVQLQELLQQLVGAREAFKVVITDEKKRLEKKDKEK